MVCGVKACFPLRVVVAASLALAIIAFLAVYFLAPAPRAAIVAAQQSACIGGCHGR